MDGIPASKRVGEIKGSCLCGWIKFTITCPPSDKWQAYSESFNGPTELKTSSCHCTKCRRSVGALYGSWASVRAELLEVTDLAMNIGTYRTSPTMTRKFCRVCGTSLFIAEDGWEVVPEDRSVSNIKYNREIQGKQGKIVRVAVATIDVEDFTEWVADFRSTHYFLDDSFDGGRSVFHLVTGSYVELWLASLTLGLLKDILKALDQNFGTRRHILSNAWVRRLTDYNPHRFRKNIHLAN